MRGGRRRIRGVLGFLGELVSWVGSIGRGEGVVLSSLTSAYGSASSSPLLSSSELSSELSESSSSRVLRGFSFRQMILRRLPKYSISCSG